MNIHINKLINILIIIFFTLSISMPKMYSSIKLYFLIILFICSFMYILNTQIVFINRKVLVWYLLFISFHVIWTFIGYLNSNEIIALLDTLRLFVIYPMIFLVFTFALSKTNKMDILFNVIVYSNFIIAIYTIFLYLDVMGIVNINFLYNFSSVIGTGVHEGYTKIGAENITSLFFTFPFVMMNREGLSVKGKKFSDFNIIITLIAILISGRRMIQLIALVLIFISFLKIINNKTKIKNVVKYSMVIILISIVTLIIKDSITFQGFTIQTFFARIIDSVKPNSDNVRYIQIVELLKAFTDNPIIGVGFGKGISYIRSIERPWSYEVTYAVMLFQTGLIGFTIYSLILGFNFYLLNDLKRKFPRDRYIRPLFYGYLFFLIACFSNPLMSSFDFMWILYIIPIYYNYMSLKCSKSIKPHLK